MENWEKVKDEIWAMFRESAKRQEEEERKHAEWKKESDRQAAERKAQYDREAAERKAEADKQAAKYKKEAAERKAQYDREAAKYAAEAAERKVEADRRSAKYDKEMAELKEQIRKSNEMINGISDSNGKMAEESLYNSLNASKMFGNVHFDDVDRNWSKSTTIADNTKLKGEYDIVMTNKVAVGLVEVKYQVRKEDVLKLADKQVKAFKLLFPEFGSYKFYLGIGGMSFGKNVENEARKLGVAILKVKGDVVEIDDKNLKVY